MSSAVSVPEKEVVGVEDSLLEREKPDPLLVALGTHRNSQVDLYVLRYEGVLQSSVFVYPSWYALRLQGIPLLDPRFSDPQRITFRKFRNTSVEDLDRVFMESARKIGLISIMDHSYTLHRPPIYEHSFIYEVRDFLEDVIKEIRVDEKL